MPLARWKDLCIDATDTARMSRFWADVLGLTYDDSAESVEHLGGPTEQHGVWINAVSEPVTVKQRVHLDLLAGSVESVEQLGAVRLSRVGEFPWTVMADPEGGELCVFVREEVPGYRLYEVVVAAEDPGRIGRWWADVIGGRVVDSERGLCYIDQIPGVPFDSIDFVPVPEPKTVKNRIHWDVDAAAVRPLVEAGARVLRERDAEIGWNVLADPEGNEFCCFPR